MDPSPELPPFDESMEPRPEPLPLDESIDPSPEPFEGIFDIPFNPPDNIPEKPIFSSFPTATDCLAFR
jgi:hypothetical protein